MAANPEVFGLLEEMLDSGKTPEEVCRDCPELLAEVRRRWQEFCRIDAEVGALLPEPGTPPAADTAPPAPHPAGLPQVPGYETEALLGRGGMGIVFRARQLRLDRLVALKMALAGAYAGPHERERFQREAEAVARLRHPNVVQIHDVGDADGQPYFTMEYVEGGNLAQRLAGTPQPARQAATLLATLAGAVQAAHRSGIVHRDLKPANVLLTADGTPKISDFGLARRLDGEAGLTRTGYAVGTPSYMAPEQARGNPDAVGPAADIYALGAILYELLTGRPPFRAETASETLQQVLFEDPVPPARLNPKVPRDLETVCLKCLHKEPRLRYASAAALAEDLDRFLQGEAIAARPEGRLARWARRARRRPVLAVAIAAGTLVTVALVGGGLWLISARAADTQRMEAEQSATERAAAQDLRDMVQGLRERRWPEARAALERAKGRLGDHGSAELRRLLDQGPRDLKLAARLDEIRLDAAGPLSGADALAACDEQYEEAFRGAGLGQVSDPPAIVAARIEASHVRKSLVAALDHWSECAPDPGRKAWILEVARKADPDPTGWRVRARTPDVRKNDLALAELIATAPIGDQSVALLLALEQHLNPTSPERVPFLKRIQVASPGDFWVNLRLGNVLMKMDRPHEAVGYYQAALAVRPGAGFVRNNFGVALWVVGRSEEALEQHRQAVQLNPTISGFHYNRGLVLLRLDRPDEALASFQRASALDPKFAEAQLAVRTTLMRLGRTEEIRLAWRTALEADPPQHDAWYGYAECCLFCGHEEEYRRARAALLAKFGACTDPYIAERTSRACLLLPAAGDELRQAVALAERAAGVERAKYQQVYAHFQFVQGLAAYRQGRLDQAIAVMRGEAAPMLGPAPRLVLALALHQKGQVAEARRMLALGILAHDWRASEIRDQDGWIVHVLRREAETRILPNLPAFLNGKYQPQDNIERFALLGVCQFTNRTRALARLYADAFAADPGLTADPRANYRYNAVRAAALAGCGRGADARDLGKEEAKAWRDKARQWLRANLAGWNKVLDGGSAKFRDVVRGVLTYWRGDPDLAGLRDPGALGKLSPEERSDCLALWAEVGVVLKRTEGARSN